MMTEPAETSMSTATRVVGTRLPFYHDNPVIQEKFRSFVRMVVENYARAGHPIPADDPL